MAKRMKMPSTMYIITDEEGTYLASSDLEGMQDGDNVYVYELKAVAKIALPPPKLSDVKKLR